MLGDAIHGFDGATDGLKAAARAFAASDVDMLAGYLDSSVDAHRIAASWIARSVIESSRGDLLDLPSVFARLDGEAQWQVLLHYLQSVQFAPEAAVPMRAVIEGLLEHPKTLVGVWAMDGLVRIAVETGKGLPDARKRVEAALSHPKASVRARARHLTQLLGSH